MLEAQGFDVSCFESFDSQSSEASGIKASVGRQVARMDYVTLSRPEFASTVYQAQF